MISKMGATIYFLAVVMISYSASADEGPFGLTLVLDKQEIERAGVILDSGSNKDTVVSYKASNLPIEPDGTDFFNIYLSEKFGIQKIIWVGKTIAGDVYGSEGKETYSELKKLLTNKYGSTSNNLERVGLTLYDEPDEFYQCLAYDGCGMWISLWDTKDLDVGLELKGMGRGKGYLVVTYEGPGWSESIKLMEGAEREKKKKAF